MGPTHCCPTMGYTQCTVVLAVLEEYAPRRVHHDVRTFTVPLGKKNSFIRVAHVRLIVKTVLKIIRAQLLPTKMRFENFPIRFFRIRGTCIIYNIFLFQSKLKFEYVTLVNIS